MQYWPRFILACAHNNPLIPSAGYELFAPVAGDIALLNFQVEQAQARLKQEQLKLTQVKPLSVGAPDDAHVRGSLSHSDQAPACVSHGSVFSWRRSAFRARQWRV